MVDLSISDGNLVLHVRGADKLWAFKSSLEIPLAHIEEIKADPTIAHGWWHGIRMPGHQNSRSADGWHLLSGRQAGFLGCSQSREPLVILLTDYRYNELIVEVADPQGAVELVKAGLRG